MRILTKALFTALPLALLAFSSAEAAQPSWKQSCEGPAVACSEAPSVASKAANPASQKTRTAKAKVAKPEAVADEEAAPAKKAKKVASKKAAKIADAKPKKKVAAKHQDDDEAPAKKVASKKKRSGDGGGSEYQSGIASWYGGQFNGRKTANGETYDMWELTAAHRTLPFGTRVKVTNLSNGDTVVVRINDRGPFVGGRVIDLSKAAANEIGMGGLAHVKLTVLGKG